MLNFQLKFGPFLYLQFKVVRTPNLPTFRFSTFLQVLSFLQIKLASPKDNCKSYIPAIRRNIQSYLSRNSNKITENLFNHVQIFFFFFLLSDKMQRTSKESGLSKKRMGSPCI